MQQVQWQARFDVISPCKKEFIIKHHDRTVICFFFLFLYLLCTLIVMITPRRSISSLTLSKESPVHPDYQDVNEAGFDLSFLCNPGQLDYVRQQCDIPTPKDLPEIAPCERFVIPTKCGSVPLILMRPKGTAHQALPVIIYL